MMRHILLSLIIILTLPALALAGPMPQDRLSDPALESRAQYLFTQLRCLVCQNQTIADSDARIASDLRLLVRTRLDRGDSDQAILDYIHSRYGDFVLMRPPVTPATWGLWFAPVILLLLGGGISFAVLRRGQRGVE